MCYLLLFCIMNVRVSDEVHSRLISHLPKKIKLSHWVDEAIIEKICRENPESVNCTEPLKEIKSCKKKK